MGAGYLERLLRQVNVLDIQQALTERLDCPMAHNRGAGGGQDVSQEGQGSSRQQHDVWIVVYLEQIDLAHHMTAL